MCRGAVGGLVCPALLLRLGLAAASAAVVAGGARASELTIKPHVAVEETYTSNVDLAPKGSEQADLVSRLNPGVVAFWNGRRVHLGLDYDPELLIYLNSSNSNGVVQNLAAAGTAELIESTLFVDTNAAINQHFVRPEGSVTGAERFLAATPTGPSEVSTTSNLVEVQTYSVSPYLRHRWSSFAEGELRYRFGAVLTDAADIGDSTIQRGTAILRSGEYFGNFSWRALLDITSTDRTITPQTIQAGSADDNRQTARIDLDYAFNPTFSLIGGVGWERIDDPTLLNSPSGVIWEAGFALRPNRDSSIRVTYGHRVDEDSFALDSFLKIGATTTLQANYSRTIDTTQGLLLNDAIRCTPDLIAQSACTVGGADRNFGLFTQTFRREAFNATLQSERGRNRYFLLGTYETRDGGLDSEKVRVAGGGAGWQRRLTPRLDLVLQFDYRNVSFQDSSGREDNEYVGFAGLRYALSDSLFAELSARYTDRVSNTSGAGLKEELLSVRLRKQF